MSNMPESTTCGAPPETLCGSLTITAAQNNLVSVYPSTLALLLEEDLDVTLSISLHLMVIYKHSCKKSSCKRLCHL